MVFGRIALRQEPTATPTLDSPCSSAEAPPSWLVQLRESVPPTTYKKGRAYASSGRVSLLTTAADGLEARVQGSLGEQYEVRLRIERGEVESRCSCPAWNQYGPHCKHVVAAAVALCGQRESSPAQERSPPPMLNKLENWLGLSAAVDPVFLYRLTPVRMGVIARQWLIDVRRQDAQSKGPVPVRRTLSSGIRLSPADEQIFSELAQRETRYDGRVVLSDEDLCELVDLLSDRRVIYRGTPLSFSSAAARLQVQLESRLGVATARLEVAFPNGTTAPFKESAVLLGRRSYAFSGQTLHALEPGFPRRLLRKWLLEPSMVFPEAQLERVLSFFAAHLPRFHLNLRADGVEVEDAVEPQFVLTLEGDAEHIRARLAARYGQTTVAVLPGATQVGYAAVPGADGKASRLYLRSESAEREAAKQLLEQGFRFAPSSQLFEASGDTALMFWVHGHKQLPEDWEKSAAHSPKVRIRNRIRPRVRIKTSGTDWFQLDTEFSVDGQAVDLGAVRLWLDSGRRFIALKDGSFAEADREELAKVAGLLEETGALPGAPSTRLPLYQAPALEMLAELREFTEVQASARKLMAELKDSSGIVPASAPEGIRAKLRPYQESGLSWLWFLHRHRLSGILADDMGLGKTLQSLTLLQKAKDAEGSKPSLVVAPTSVLVNWQREVERFAPQLTTALWHGQERKERAESLRDVDLVLTSYALARRDVEELSRIGWRYLVLDEAQNIKNADSVTAQACKSLPSEQRLALTGTPLENRLAELWSIFDFLMPGFLGSAEDFAERYVQRVEIDADPEARERLRRRIGPFLLRRLKDEVARDLPPKTESVAYCEMDPGQAALYREVLEESRRKIYQSISKVGFKRSQISILSALTRLRQVCCDARLLHLPPRTLLPPSAKRQRFWELVEDLVSEGHRALVFSQFTQMLALLTEEADERKIPYLYLDGRTRDRMSRVDAFNSPEGPPLFFISLKAGGTGLNLTAADYVLHYDPWWNPAVEEQATDRTHRIGQTKAVISYKLIVRCTVEEKILNLQSRKKQLAEGLLSRDTALGKLLTESDLEELLRIDR